jgi:hypothetical protein
MGASELGAVRFEAVREQAKSPILPNHGQGKMQLASDLVRWERIVEAIGPVMYVKPKERES